MNFLSQTHVESSPHTHDFRLRLNSSDFILVRVSVRGVTPIVAYWLNRGDETSVCPLEWRLVTELVEKALRIELEAQK